MLWLVESRRTAELAAGGRQGGTETEDEGKQGGMRWNQRTETRSA